MRDYVLCYVNGREHRVTGRDVFQPASSYLRLNLMYCGTKVVCAEGDCGACSVMVGRLAAGSKGGLTYAPLNSCIQYMYQLDRCHLITVEGLGSSVSLSAVQASMVDNHGAQCGYCTPGFVVAMSAFAQRVKCGLEKMSECAVKDALTGNLCRCTGYESIIKAGLDIDLEKVADFAALYPEAEIIAAFERETRPLQVRLDGNEVYYPEDLPSACRFLKESQDAGHKAVIVSGGTDISVNLNKKGLKAPVIMGTQALKHDLEGRRLDAIELLEDGGRSLSVGALVTLRDLEHYFKTALPEFHNILWVFGSPQIRHAGTLAGNIANGSPIADSLPFFMVMNGSVEVTGSGGSRLIPAASLYTGYKQLSLKPDELITRIILPLPRNDQKLKLYKVSRRRHLDISAFTAAFLFDISSDSVVDVRIFYGGVGPLVARMSVLEDALRGKPLKLDSFVAASELVAGAIKPIDDVRGASGYRMQLAKNILSRVFYDLEAELGLDKEALCR